MGDKFYRIKKRFGRNLKRTSIYVDPYKWEMFKRKCREWGVSASELIEHFIDAVLGQQQQSPKIFINVNMNINNNVNQVVNINTLIARQIFFILDEIERTLRIGRKEALQHYDPYTKFAKLDGFVQKVLSDIEAFRRLYKSPENFEKLFST